MTSCRPFRRTSFPSLGDTTPALEFRPHRGRALPRAGLLELVTRYLQPGIVQWKRQDLLRSWGTPCALALLSDPGRTGASGQHDASGAAPAMSTAKAPAWQLSRLNHTASALAVYASQAGSPRHHARLASGCWPSSSGRDCLPAGFQQKVSRCILHLSLLFQVLVARTSLILTAEKAVVNSENAAYCPSR